MDCEKKSGRAEWIGLKNGKASWFWQKKAPKKQLLLNIKVRKRFRWLF